MQTRAKFTGPARDATAAAAQAILDRFRFMEDGRDLFPRRAEELTAAELARVLYLGEQKARLNALKAEEARLVNLRAILSGLTTGGR